MFRKTKFTSQEKSKNELQSILDALMRSQAEIEFAMDGTILSANDNFLTALGYQASEVVGQKHAMFIDADYRVSDDYRRFWEALRRGEYQAAQYKRIGKGGKEVWIEASYNPILDRNGKPFKVIKFATDITDIKLKNADYEGQIQAIRTSQAVIEFDMDGRVVDANANFLAVMGYDFGEIKGRHHSTFVEAGQADSPAYADFWSNLKRGEFQAAQFKRIGKGGKEVWIEASYNPIKDASGRPFKVVKYATDISGQVALIQNVRSIMELNVSEIETAVGMVAMQSASASSGSTQTTANVQAVALGAEELHASVQEISQNMTRAKTETEDVFEKIVTASEQTAKLEIAAQAMNGIVEIIQGIASQVNLLSLNATIEAARAGEAGKGFAVVASEVKNLAGQASDATGKISDEIVQIQHIVRVVVDGLDAVRTSLNRVRDYVTNVAGAVEEQSSVAQDMSSNMQSASQAVAEIARNLTQIVAATETAHGTVLTTKQAAASLAKSA